MLGVELGVAVMVETSSTLRAHAPIRVETQRAEIKPTMMRGTARSLQHRSVIGVSGFLSGFSQLIGQFEGDVFFG